MRPSLCPELLDQCIFPSPQTTGKYMWFFSFYNEGKYFQWTVGCGFQGTTLSFLLWKERKDTGPELGIPGFWHLMDSATFTGGC